MFFYCLFFDDFEDCEDFNDFLGLGDFYDLDDSDWDMMEDFDELTEFDKKDPMIYLKEGFTFIQGNYADYYGNLLQIIGSEEMKVLESKIKEHEN